MIDLQALGYRLDRRTRVWARPQYSGLNYSDGDALEEYLAQVIAQTADVSLLSDELAAQTQDWVSLYHLGRARANILRPFEACFTGRAVLEIGAGCGAISRYLGECGATLLSLEGSLRRARIAASRTRDLDNVTVLAERFEHFQAPHGFAVVTLVGVLEYASMFADGSAALDMLCRVRELLAPDGLLLLAIENQLGLKYFAGAPEDHLGRPMYGIEGRYRPDEPRTFGRQSLQRLLETAGFGHTEFMVPLPDYKLANALVTTRGLAHPGFDAAALAWQNVRKDPQLPVPPLFNLERAWPQVIGNGLGLELANAFVVAAGCAPLSVPEPSLLACHYNVSRTPAFCKQTRFVAAHDGIEVHNQPLDARAGVPLSALYRHSLSALDPWSQGQALSQQFLRIASSDWIITDFAAFIVRYLEALRGLLHERGLDLPLDQPDQRLPGSFLDAVAHNILIAADGRPALIDVEWQALHGVSLGHLLVRALLLLIASAVPFSPRGRPMTRRQFMSQALGLAGIEIGNQALEGLIAQEAQFQAFATGRPASEFLDWKPDEVINQRPSTVRTRVQAKLYYSERAGQFSEALCMSQEVWPGPQTLRFMLPGGARWLRLDPVDQPIWFALDNLRLISGGDHEVWRWEGRADSLGTTAGIIQVEPSRLPALFVSLDDDPCIELPLDLAALAGGTERVLVMDLVLYTDRTIARRLGQALDQTHAQERALRQAFDPLTEQVGDLARRMSDLDALAQSIRQRVSEGEAGTLQAIEALLGEQQRIGEQHARLVSQLEDELRSVQAEKDSHVHRLNMRIRELEGAYSRRLAAPLRQGVLAARRLSGLMQRTGGWSAGTRRAAAILREQGLGSLVRRLFPAQASAVPVLDAPPPGVADRHDYAAWIAQYDTLDDAARQRIGEHIGQWPQPPLISVIMPVYEAPLTLLRQAIDSVRGQLYPHWELCVADDASRDPAVHHLLREAQRQDARIKVVFRSRNGHIAQASNSALDIATGDYVALLDQDDLLAEHALYWVARTIVERPDVGLIYSDEDKIDLQGRRSAPYFKPDWNGYLFRSQNLVSHLGVYRRTLVEQVGRLRSGFEGSQDYDLALRCIEKLAPAQIVHISRVLYHWRVHAGSTAMAGDEKPYAAQAGIRALDDHLQRTGRKGWTQLLPIGMYRVHYQLPAAAPLVSVIIPTRNACELVRQCIDSLVRLTTYPHYEIILVDNGSDEPEALDYFAQLTRDPRIRLLRDERPFNYSALNNRAVAQARGELVALLNNDIEIISPDWLDQMVALALQPDVGAVGARLWFPDERLQHGGVILGIGGIANHAHKFLPKGEHGYFGRAVLIQEFSAVTAACLVIRKALFERIGGLDEDNLAIAFNDVDFCLRVREAGYLNVWTPYAELYHHESATRGQEDSAQKQQRFSQEVAHMTRRWPDICRDAAYNPNLTLDHLDFGLAWPPRLDP